MCRTCRCPTFIARLPCGRIECLMHPNFGLRGNDELGALIHEWVCSARRQVVGPNFAREHAERETVRSNAPSSRSAPPPRRGWIDPRLSSGDHERVWLVVVWE